MRPGAHDDRGGARGQVAAQLRRARHDVLAVGDPAREQVLEEVADGGLGRPLGRARALELEPIRFATSRSSARRRRLAARPVAQPADLGVGHPQLDRLGPASPAITARSSSGDAQATASTLLAGSSTITLASSARLAARATAGRPAPDSTASETSSSASGRSASAAGISGHQA